MKLLIDFDCCGTVKTDTVYCDRYEVDEGVIILRDLNKVNDTVEKKTAAIYPVQRVIRIRRDD